MDGARLPSGVRKVKKKQAKDELDRIKQAEKKKRRLEKALATSAAIRSELEKKKQKKKEEQQKLDEEGAAIAEAVALHVLLGEDSDDSCKGIMKDEGLNRWDCCSNFDIFMGGREDAVPHEDFSNNSLKNIEWVYDNRRYGYMGSNRGNTDWMVSSEPLERQLYPQYLEDGGWDTAGISAGLIAAQAVSSLQIGEDAQVDKYVFNRMLRGQRYIGFE